MEHIRQYLLSIIAAAILCGLINTLIGKKGAYSAVIRLISGLFMALTVISPVVNIQLQNFTDYVNSFSQQAGVIVNSAEAMAWEERNTIIKSRAEAYILDKAVSMKLELDVEVTLSDTNPPLPCAVTIKGSVSPYSKEVLSSYIANDLGISKEDQLWI